MPETDSYQCIDCRELVPEGEFHPHPLCLLAKARDGGLPAAREDIAFIVAMARSEDPKLKAQVDKLLDKSQADRESAEMEPSIDDG